MLNLRMKPMYAFLPLNLTFRKKILWTRSETSLNLRGLATCLYVALILNLIIVTVADETDDCKIIKEKNPEINKREKELLDRLRPLKGTIFDTSDYKDTEKSDYFYKLGICTRAVKSIPHSGVVQFNSSNPNGNWTIGRLNATKIMGGTDWILLSYSNGDPYSHQCNAISRTTNIMIVCDPVNLKGKFQILEERKKIETDYCYYLFELSSSIACTITPVKKGLSSGSLFCIIFFTLTVTYFCVGFLYKRLIIGAKGIEQIPNYSFWRDFGNLQADGCDFICRCGPRHEEHAYRGIDDQLPKEEDDRDDQLLAM